MSTRVRIPPIWLCWFCCLGSLSAYFWSLDDRTTASSIGVVGVAGLVGYWLGGALVLASIVGMGTASLFAARIAEAFGPAIHEFCGATGAFNRILAACFGCITVGLAGMLWLEVVWKRMLQKEVPFQLDNKALGLFFGAIQGVLLSAIILGGSLVAEPYARSSKAARVDTVKDYLRQCTADGVTRIARNARNSCISPYLNEYNPFERLPTLKSLLPTKRPNFLAGTQTDK